MIGYLITMVKDRTQLKFVVLANTQAEASNKAQNLFKTFIIFDVEIIEVFQ